jgi:hypothetical protein
VSHELPPTQQSISHTNAFTLTFQVLLIAFDALFGEQCVRRVTGTLSEVRLGECPFLGGIDDTPDTARDALNNFIHLGQQCGSLNRTFSHRVRLRSRSSTAAAAGWQFGTLIPSACGCDSRTANGPVLFVCTVTCCFRHGPFWSKGSSN